MRDIIVMIGFLGLLPLCFTRPFIGILVWSWFSLMNPHREVYGFAYGFNFNLIIAVATFIGLFLSAEKITPTKNAAVYLIFLFFGWTIITTFASLDPITSWVFFNSSASRTYIFIFMLVLLVDREERLIAMIWLIAISLGYYGARIGIVGLLSGGSSSVGTAENFGPTNTMIQDRNHMVVALTMMFPLLLFLYKYTQEKFVKNMIRIVAAFTVVAVIISYSRTGLLCLMMIAGYYFMFVRNKILIIIAIIMVMSVSFMFMPKEWQERMTFSQEKIETDSSLSIRFEAWKLARAIAADNPATGGGFRYVQNPKSMKMYPGVSLNPYAAAAHSVYFEVLSDHGYVGLIFFIIMLLSGLYMNFSTRRIVKPHAEYRWVYDLTTAFQLSISVYMLGGAALSLAYYELIYVMIVLSAALNFITRKKFITQAKAKLKRQYLS